MSYLYNDVHKNECENQEYYQCPRCDEIVHESEKNLSPTCVLFIPKASQCVCEFIPTLEPDWDWIRKEQMENPN